MTDPFALTQCKTMTLEDYHKMELNRYVMEPKIDGWRIQMDVTPDHITAWTRTNHIASGKLPRPEDALIALAKSHGKSFRLDGEVVYLDAIGDPYFNYTSRCMGSRADVCVEKQREQDRYLSYVVFDILALDDKDLRKAPMESRRETLERILYRESDYVFPIGISTPDVQVHFQNIEQFGEGSVLKDRLAPYAGKRHKSWLKWKAEETVDVVITGYKEGQGKFAGLIGAIEFRAPDGIMGNCSGMSDATRVEISNHREEYRGRTIEIKHYGILVEGYRHPQFVRFRYDK